MEKIMQRKETTQQNNENNSLEGENGEKQDATILGQLNGPSVKVEVFFQI